jgi:6-phosphogluconolactonase
MRTAAPVWHEFPARRALAATLARDVAEELVRGIEARGEAVLAVSGGTTPVLFLRALSEQPIDWTKVCVTLVDERFVSASSERSNARFVTLNLLQNEAAKARFVELYSETESVEEAADAARERLRDLPSPFDVVVLGMGTDGHTASFFSDGDRYRDAVDPVSDAIVVPLKTGEAREPRLTLTLAQLVPARFLAFHIEGLEKKEVLRAAQSDAAASSLPVAEVLEHRSGPIQVYWTPDEDSS